MAFDASPSGPGVVLFGGQSSAGLFNDTWEYSGGQWKLVPCLNGPACPPALSQASIAYDPALWGLLMVGGLTANCATGCNESVSHGVYLWQNGVWSTLSPAPFSVFGASMAWDTYGSCMLLFGGNDGTGPVNASWCYKASAWNSVATTQSPPARWGASMTNLSTNMILLFGGETLTGPESDTWEFASDQWVPVVAGSGPSPGARGYASLVESPAAALGIPVPTNSAILYGGESSSGATLSDTWLFTGDIPRPTATTSYGNWTADPSTPTPPGLLDAASASDFSDSLVILFGGVGGAGYSVQGSTWGYFHPVAILTANSTELPATAPEVFQTLVAGGRPPYSYSYGGLPPGCFGGNSATLSCSPTQFGIYNVSVSVEDSAGRSASSNLTVQVDPADTQIFVNSEYTGRFFTGVPLNNSFGATATTWGRAPLSVVGTLSGATFPFRSTSEGWVASVSNMGNVTPGAVLRVSANFTNWTVHATLPIDMVETPSWMQSFLRFGGPSMLFQPSGAGPWNKSYEFDYPMSWTFGNLIQFAVPTPGFVGNYMLLPTSLANFYIDSTGNVSLEGAISDASESLQLGPITITPTWPDIVWTNGIRLTGNFATRSVNPHIYTVDFNSATASVWTSITLQYSVNIFPSETPEGKLGLSAVISLSPTVTLSVVLGPSAPGKGSFLSGLDIVLKDLLVQLDFALGLTVQVGIDNLFEIGVTGTLDFNLIFQTAVPHLAGFWINASVVGFVSFLFLTISFTFWAGTIYHTGNGADPAGPLADRVMPSVGQPWQLASRYYNGSSYEAIVWNSSATNGTAIEDLYPQAVPTLAGAGSSALLLYASDDVARPEAQALGLRGMELDPSSGTLTPISLPETPGTVSFAPQVYGLSNGDAAALWTAIPTDRLNTLVPDQMTGFELMTSTRSGGQWSDPVSLQSWGYPVSYAIDARGAGTGTPLAAVLVSPVLAPNATTPERLLVYDLSADALVSNVSVVGLGSLTGFDSTDSWAFAHDLANSPTVVNSSTGATVVLGYSAGAAYTWEDATPVAGAPGTLGLLFRGPSSDELALYSPSGARGPVTLVLPENTSTLHVFATGSQYSIFAGTPAGVDPYLVSSNLSKALPPWRIPSMVQFGVAPVGTGFVLYAVSSHGNRSEPIDDLSLDLLGPFETGSSPGPVCSFGGIGCTTASELLGGILVFLVLAGVVVFFRGRHRPPRAPAEPFPTGGPRAD